MPGRSAEIRAFFDLKRKIDGHLQICPAEYLCCVFSTGSPPLQPDAVRIVCRLTAADLHHQWHFSPLCRRFSRFRARRFLPLRYDDQMEHKRIKCAFRFNVLFRGIRAVNQCPAHQAREKRNARFF